MSDLRIRVYYGRHKTIVTPCGSVDLTSSAKLGTDLADLVEHGHRHIVLNLSHIEYMDSTGIAVLSKTHRELRFTGGVFHVVGCPPNLIRILQVLGFHHLFSVHPRREPRDAPAQSEAGPAQQQQMVAV